MDLQLKAISGFLTSSKKDEVQRYEKIEWLKGQLVKEGYQPSEAEHFVKEALGARKLSELSAEELHGAIERLEHQLAVARKCKNIFK